MKREIEFRGKTAKGKWAYGYYGLSKIASPSAMFLGKGDVFIEKSFIFNELLAEKVIPETVGQYVGIKDKNGKKVYEGDIVKDEYGRIMEVVWREKFSKFAFKLIKTTGEKWTENFLYADMGDWFDLENHLPEVIGNIFDKESENE